MFEEHAVAVEFRTHRPDDRSQAALVKLDAKPNGTLKFNRIF